jgi:cytochrome c556
MEQNGQSEPTSFFEVPDDSVQERTGFLDDKWNPRDEKIAEIHAELASKTRILPEQVDPQRKLLFENAITKYWTPLSDKDTRRFGAPDAQTEKNFEKAVTEELERERQVLRKQGLRDDQIASKMDGREQQARVGLAKNNKEFFTIRDKPFEAQKGKTNEEVLQDARAAYDEAEQKFKTKLNKLLDDANERTNDEARTAKIQLEKARKNLVQAFTGEDDPELVKKYNEMLQMSGTRQEAEKKIFEYKLEPSTLRNDSEIQQVKNVETPSPDSYLIPEPGEEYDEDDVYFSANGTMGHFILAEPGNYVWESLSDYHEQPEEEDISEISRLTETDANQNVTRPVGSHTPNTHETVIGSPYPFVEAQETDDPNVHSYEYFVVQGKMERDQLRNAVSTYLTDPNPHNLRQVQLGINSLNQLSTMDVDDPKSKSMFEQLKAEYTGLALDVELLIDSDNKVNPEQFWRWFNRDVEKIEKSIDSRVDSQYKPWLEKDSTDGLESLSEKLKGLTEKYPDTALSDETIDAFITDHLIDTSDLRSAYVAFNENPSDENRSKLLAAVDVVGEAYKALPDLSIMPFRESQGESVSSKQGVDHTKGIEKYKGYKDFTKDVQNLLNYALEATGEIPSTLDPAIQADKDARNKIVYDILRDRRRAIGLPALEYPVTAEDIKIQEAFRQWSEGTTQAQMDAEQARRAEVANQRGKKVRQEKEDEYYRQLFANGGGSENEPVQVVEISDGNVDQFVSEHMVDVHDLYQKYEEYRDELVDYQKLRKLSKEDGSSISEEELNDKKAKVAQVASELTPLVQKIDEDRENGKGLDPKISLQVANGSIGQEVNGKSRTAKKVHALLSYHKQISQLLDYADEATGDKKAKNKSTINRSSEDVEELLEGIQQNIDILNPQSQTTDQVIDVPQQAQLDANPFAKIPRPENVIDLPPTVIETRKRISDVGKAITDVRDTYFLFGQTSSTPFAVTEKLRVLNGLRNIISEQEGTLQSESDTQGYVDALKKLVPAVEQLQYSNPDNYGDLERAYRESFKKAEEQWREALVAEYDREIDSAIEQSTPDDKKLVEIPFETFKTIVQPELLDYAGNVRFNMRYPKLDNTYKQRSREQRAHIQKLLDNLYISEERILNDREREYLTSLKAYYKLATEGEDNTSLIGNDEAVMKFREQLFEQQTRMLLGAGYQ